VQRLLPNVRVGLCSHDDLQPYRRNDGPRNDGPRYAGVIDLVANLLQQNSHKFDRVV
jgi:hypothetical protein